MEHVLMYVPMSLQPNHLRNINWAPLLLIMEALERSKEISIHKIFRR